MTEPSHLRPPVHDRTGRLATLLSQTSPVVLELGCGPRKRIPGSVGIDIRAYDPVDVVGDLLDVLREVPDSSVDLVHSSHVLEHLDPLEALMQQLQRIVKPGGRVVTVVPHFSNPYYYSDYTHRRQFGLYSFSYLAVDRIFRRTVPHYEGEPAFALVDVTLGFKAAPPMYLRHACRKVFGWVVNRTRLTQEWYEAGWCWLFPCYEVEFVIERRPEQGTVGTSAVMAADGAASTDGR
ncbi:MAG TPA: class I SAM-dependent methyltransferase [Luteitalea sp.]|nr:class I SAM-dependent methyltransferase [Luteitalea sp.]